MFVLIVGGGQVGRYLAEMLVRDRQRVVVVEKNPAVADQISRSLGIEVVRGDGDDPTVLESAGARGADVFVAVTGEDEDNLVACTLAKSEFQVGRVLARVNNPKNEWMFGKDMGVDIAISQAAIIATLLEEQTSLGDLVTLMRLQEGNVTLVEKLIPPTARCAGCAVKDLGLPVEGRLVAVLRQGKVLFPSGDLVLEPGDRVILLTTPEQEQEIARLLA